MTDFDTAARQEAERRDRYETTPPRSPALAFEAGARWGAEQADAEVRRLTAALAEVAALADEADSTDPWVRASDLRDLLAKHEMKDGVK